MTAEKLKKLLISLDACEGAIKWVEGKDLKTAWQTCQRGDWMIWLLCNSENEVTDREMRLTLSAWRSGGIISTTADLKN